MISAWTKHISDAAEKEKFKQTVLSSKTTLQRLQAMINEMKEEVDNLELNNKIYDVPNWDYRQAHLNGFKDAIKKINRILTLDQQDNK